MTCEPWQAAISARLDGEDLGVEPRLLQAHLAGCAECRAFEDALACSITSPHVEAVAPMPDLSRRTVRLAAMADRAASWSIVRVLLAVVAIDVIVFAVRSLLQGDSTDGAAHTMRHLGAFSVAYGVGLLVVVVRPARARTMLPVAGVLAGALFITAVIDLINGNVPLTGEATHLPELISVLLIWMLAVPSPRRASTASATSTTGGLRSVPAPRDEAV